MDNPVFTYLKSLFAFVLLIWIPLSGFSSIWINLHLVVKTLTCALESEVTDSRTLRWWGPHTGEVDLVQSKQNWQLILSLKGVAAFYLRLVALWRAVCVCVCVFIYYVGKTNKEIWPRFGQHCKLLCKQIKYYYFFKWEKSLLLCTCGLFKVFSSDFHLAPKCIITSIS